MNQPNNQRPRTVVARCPRELIEDFAPHAHSISILPSGGALLSFRAPHEHLHITPTGVYLAGERGSGAMADVVSLSAAPSLTRVPQAEGYSFSRDFHSQDAIRVTGRGVQRYKLFMLGKLRLVSEHSAEWRVRETHSATLGVDGDGSLTLTVRTPFLDSPHVVRARHPHELRAALREWGDAFRSQAGLDGPRDGALGGAS